MHVDLVWLTVALLSFPLITLCDPLNVLLAPNILRVGTEEKVFVEAQDYSGNDLQIKISVKNYPQKTAELTSATTTLTAANNYQSLVKIKIPDVMGFFSDGPLDKQYVYLQAEFPTSVLEKMVLVSFQSSYIFVQTDKSIYTPGTQVLYRIFLLAPDLQPNDYPGGIDVDIINHSGHTIKKDVIYPNEAIIRGNYNIPEITKFGMWSIVVKFKNAPHKNVTAQFEVKEYVLPIVEVTLQPIKPFIYVHDEKFEVLITAKYQFGKNVEGVAFVVFEVRKDNARFFLPDSSSTIPITNGVGRAVLTRSMIQQSINNDLVGGSLFISASVLTQTGSEIIKAEKGDIQIVKSPYTIEFKKTPKYFHPGMPFDVTVYVTNADQSPAPGVMINVGEVQALTKNNGIAKVTVNTNRGMSTLEITARTNDPSILNERQAENKMIAEAYTTKGGSSNYLRISVDSAELQIEDKAKFFLMMQSSVQDQYVTYVILSKGQIVKAERYNRKGQSLIILSERITKDLVPSFRLVAYYHVGSEIVSDSIWVDVKDTCMGTLKLSVKDNPDGKIYEPGEEFNLVVTGDPSAKVGLVAVDKGVFALNKNRLTQSKIWNFIEKYDTGCTAGSGKDSMGVFYDAGLLFQSDKAGGTKERTDIDCPTQPKRKRREPQIPQSLGDDDFISSDEIVTRTEIPESWLWEEISLPGCPENNPCTTTSLTMNKKYLKDSITTWQVLAISLSKSHGICVADPIEITVAKDFFVDLKLPYSAVHNKQVEIKAILYNFSNRLQRVRVEFFETENICSVANKKKKHHTVVNVDPKSSRSVPFVIIPMRIGEHDIEVQAASASYQDGVRKSLKVVPNGVLTELLQKNLYLNPSLFPDGIQTEEMKTAIPSGQVPNTPAHTYITVTAADDQKTKLDVQVNVSGRIYPIKWIFNNRNVHFSGLNKVRLQQTLDVTAKGNGVGVLKVMTTYYARPIEQKSDCERFTVTVKMKREAETSYKDAEESYMFSIDILFKNPERDATVVILDIGLLTGFVVDKSDLTKLSSGKDKIIHKFEELSDRGSLIIYLYKVSNKVPNRFAFRMHKMQKVDILQPASVSVYEYNDSGERCVKFYHPTKKDGALSRLCSNQEGLCECAEENCSIQKKLNIKDNERELRACEADIDYVYKVKVVETNLNPNTDFYEMEIEVILKEGIDQVNPGNQRTFMGLADCRSAFNFVEGKSYLLMGQRSNILKEDFRLLYILGEKTWIEYWPMSVEGQTDEYKQNHQGITALANALLTFGCPT